MVELSQLVYLVGLVLMRIIKIKNGSLLEKKATLQSLWGLEKEKNNQSAKVLIRHQKPK